MAGKQQSGARGRGGRRGGVLGILLVASLAMAWLAGALSRPAGAADGGRHAAQGYFLADSGGHMTRFGEAMDTGSLLGTTLRAPIVDGDTTPSGNGSVLVASDGGVFAFGDAPYLGSMAGTPLAAPIVTIEMTPTGRGYLMAASDGGVFAFGDARFRGSLGGLRLNQPIVDMALNATNDGYFLAAADGGVFAFGQARFRGSMGGRTLNKPVVGILADEVSGYGLVASDGGVFAFGRFVFRGGLGSLTLRSPIVDAVVSSTGDGYNMVASDGGVFAFGDAPFVGSVAHLPLPRPIVTILGLGNQPPDAKDDAYTATEDTVLTRNAAAGVLANDTDDEGDPITAAVATGPTKGSLVLNANGSFTYTPNANANGADSFTYTVSDPHGKRDTGTVSITVNGVNDAPVAANDAHTTSEDTPLVVAAPGVLANDGDVEGSTLTAKVVAGPTKGTLVLRPNGSFTYTPNANANGADFFTYRANDGTADSNVATVSLTVNAVNDAPVAVNDAHTTNEDTALNVAAPGVLANDSDVEGSPMTTKLVKGPSHGTLTLNANGSFSYTPIPNYNGPDSFSYRASDGTADSNVATVSLTVKAVNDPPVAVDDTFTTNEDTALNGNVLANDSDLDGDTLTASVVNHPSHGTVTVNPNGSFTYSPAPQYSGPDSFTYAAWDGKGGSDTALVSITVKAVNDAPVALDDTYNTNEDTVLNIPAPGVLANDSDAEGNSMTTVLVAAPSHGTLTLNPNGSFAYTPHAHYNGADSFKYKASDGTAQGNTATVTLGVAPVNDVPTATSDAYSTNEDVQLTVPAPGVLANDSDADGNSLTAVLVAGPGKGTLTLNPNGSFSYKPNANFNGPDSFTYKANDGTAESAATTVSLTVNAVNDAPVAVNDSYNTNEDTVLNIPAPGVLANDSDADGNPLTAVLVTGPGKGTLTLNPNGSFSYKPNANFNGPDSFTYKAKDGTAESTTATVTLTVGPVNDAPVADNDSYSTDEDTQLKVVAPGVLDGDTDADGNPLTAVLVANPSKGSLTLNANGSFTYTPNANFSGSDSFTYKANDGGADSNIATVTITVNAVNDAPVAVDDAYTTAEDTPLVVSAPGVLANDTDVEGPLSATSFGDAANGTVVGKADGSFTFTPASNFNGTASFGYTVSDGTTTDTGTVTITVSPVNDAPTAGNNNFSTKEDTQFTVAAPGVLADDTDTEGDPLAAIKVSDPTLGVVTLNADGSFTYTPNADANGADSFTYKANDGSADSNTATVFITIDAVEEPPVAGDDGPFGALQDKNFTLAAPGVLANDSDPDGQALTAGNASDPANGTVTLNADGSFSYDPDPGFTGTDTFTYDVSDGVATDTGLVTINVSPPNATPTADAVSKSGNEDGGAITVTLTGHDADGDTLTFTATTPTNGVVTVPSGTTCDGNTPSTCTATTTYTPKADFNGGDSFTYTVYDGTAHSAAATVTITIASVNDEPSFTKGSDQTVNEDAGAQTVSGWATAISEGPANESAQTVTFTVTTDNDGLFSALPAVSSAGDLTFTPAANANGSATVSVTPVDDGGTANGGDDTGATQTFKITVSPVNDAPSFTKGGDQTVDEDAGAKSIANWATAISKGPADESGQSLSFTTSNDNNALFSVQPNVTSTGTLVYTTAPNRYGSATVTVSLSDDGGTANGGDDTSDSQTFTITVKAVNDAPVAAAKAFTVQANMKISLGGLLTGATDPNDVAGDAAWSPTFSVGSITVGAGCVGCTISNIDTANGSFDFDPPAGGTGTYTVSYTVVDSGHPAPGVASAPQTITFTVNGPVIWFVDTAAPTGGTGRLSAPFNNLPSATSAMGANVNQRIFVRGGNVTGNVTLPTDGWLISEAATGTNFDDVMGLGSSVPAGTIARPAVNGTQRTLTGTVTLGTNSVVRGFDLTPSSGSPGLVASGKTGLVVNQLSSSTTNARAVDLANSSGTFTLKKVQASGANRGLSLVNVNTSTGSFTVTGAGAASSGGVITGSTATGTAGAPEGGIYLNNTKNVSLAWMTVSDGKASGIYGTNVTTLNLTNSTVSNNGDNALLDHSGIWFDNLLGTSTISGVTVSGSHEDSAKIVNTSGTTTLTVSNSTFRDNHRTLGANGLLVNALGSSNVTFTSTNNNIVRNRTSGLAIFAQSTVKTVANVTGGTYITDNGVGLDIEANGPGGMAFNVNGGTVTGCFDCGAPVNIYKGTGATGTGANAMAGTINGMTVTNGDGQLISGIWVHGEGAGALRVAVTNNNISQVDNYGIWVSTGNGSSVTDVTITDNVITGPAVATAEGIRVETGTLDADTTSLCADVRTNTVTTPGDVKDIGARIRQAGTKLRLPGYTGAATDINAVANYLVTRNNIADATAFIDSETSGFTGGNPTTCTAP